MIKKRDFNRLIKSASKGDTAAFGRLFDRYYDAVFVYVHHHVGDKKDAEEITSGVFLAALENMGKFGRSGEGFGVWLFNIARSDVNDFKKKRGRYKEAAAVDVTQEATPADTVQKTSAADALQEGATKADLEETVPAEEIVKEAPAEGKAVTRKVLLAHAGSLATEGTQRPQAAGRERTRPGVWRKRTIKSAGLLRSRRLLAPLAVAAAVLLFTGTAWAASGASPDSSLYPLKERLEDVRTFLAMQGLDRAASETERAGKRLDEILEMVDRDRPGYVPTLLARCDRLIDNASTKVDETGYTSSESYAIAGMIEGTLERRRAVLREISDRLPDNIRAEIADELLALEEGPGSGSPVTVAAVPTAPSPAADAAATATDACDYATYSSGYAAVYGYGGQCYCIDYAGRVYVIAAAEPVAAATGAATPGAAAGVAADDPPPDAVGVKPDPSPPPADTGSGGGNGDDNHGDSGVKSKKSKKHRD